MKATHRVKNSSRETVGFIVDNDYVKYYDALQNIDLIDNLSLTTDREIKPENGELEDIQIYRGVSVIFSE